MNDLNKMNVGDIVSFASGSSGYVHAIDYEGRFSSVLWYVKRM